MPNISIVASLVLIVVVVIALAAVVSILRSQVPVVEKLLWIALALLVPIVGPVLWFAWGVRARTQSLT